MKALAALFTAAAVSAVSAQQPVFRSTGALVRLDVSVTDVHGKVRGLHESDFIVTDGGRRQTVHVDESADAALDLVLVAQPIASIALTSREQASRMAAGLAMFLAHTEDRDRFGAIVAGAPPTRLRALELGRPSFDSGVFANGMYAAPFDAIAAALTEFSQSDRRKALIVFSNGGDFRSTISLDALAQAAGRLGPAFVLIASPIKISESIRVSAEGGGGQTLATAGSSVSGWLFPATLERLAKRSGGFTLDVGAGDPAKLIADLFARLRTQYVITYEPPPGKGWHPVSVTVSRKGVTVSTREGYSVS